MLYNSCFVYLFCACASLCVFLFSYVFVCCCDLLCDVAFFVLFVFMCALCVFNVCVLCL